MFWCFLGVSTYICQYTFPYTFHITDWSAAILLNGISRIIDLNKFLNAFCLSVFEDSQVMLNITGWKR